MTVAVQFDTSTVPDLEEIDVPGMISPDEEKLYFHIARSCAAQPGKTLEIGTWLGRSTLRICQGLEASHSKWNLFCYDRFE